MTWRWIELRIASEKVFNERIACEPLALPTKPVLNLVTSGAGFTSKMCWSTWFFLQKWKLGISEYLLRKIETNLSAKKFGWFSYRNPLNSIRISCKDLRKRFLFFCTYLGRFCVSTVQKVCPTFEDLEIFSQLEKNELESQKAWKSQLTWPGLEPQTHDPQRLEPNQLLYPCCWSQPLFTAGFYTPCPYAHNVYYYSQ